MIRKLNNQLQIILNLSKQVTGTNKKQRRGKVPPWATLSLMRTIERTSFLKMHLLFLKYADSAIPHTLYLHVQMPTL